MQSGTTGGLNETITVAFSDSTTFSVSSNWVGGCQGNSGAGLTSTEGSTTSFSVADKCSFSVTQGSTPFAAGDRFSLHNSQESCIAGNSYFQTNPPSSACAEETHLVPLSGEVWSPSGHSAEKGGLGKNSIPSVRWRLPTVNDYKLGLVNGAAFVLPNMMISGGEWTATTESIDRTKAFLVIPPGIFQSTNLDYLYKFRCVDR